MVGGVQAALAKEEHGCKYGGSQAPASLVAALHLVNRRSEVSDTERITAWHCWQTPGAAALHLPS